MFWENLVNHIISNLIRYCEVLHDVISLEVRAVNGLNDYHTEA